MIYFSYSRDDTLLHMLAFCLTHGFAEDTLIEPMRNIKRNVPNTLGSTSIRYRPDAKVSNRCLIDVDPGVFASCVFAVYKHYITQAWGSIKNGKFVDILPKG